MYWARAAECNECKAPRVLPALDDVRLERERHLPVDDLEDASCARLRVEPDVSAETLQRLLGALGLELHRASEEVVGIK